jgi:hypothetical protein
VVQQAQGRVQPTMQMAGGVAVNDDAGLEREADVMGVKALLNQNRSLGENKIESSFKSDSSPIQRIPRSDLAKDLSKDTFPIVGDNYEISESDVFVIRKIIGDTPQLKQALLSGFKLPTARDFNKFVGSLKLNYENILRAPRKITYRKNSFSSWADAGMSLICCVPAGTRIFRGALKRIRSIRITTFKS